MIGKGQNGKVIDCLNPIYPGAVPKEPTFDDGTKEAAFLWAMCHSNISTLFGVVRDRPSSSQTHLLLERLGEPITWGMLST